MLKSEEESPRNDFSLKVSSFFSHIIIYIYLFLQHIEDALLTLPGLEDHRTP